MNIRDTSPGLDAEALKTMRINAIRLCSSGVGRQRGQAPDALALIGGAGNLRGAALPAALTKAQRKSGIDSSPKTNAKGRSTNVAS